MSRVNPKMCILGHPLEEHYRKIDDLDLDVARGRLKLDHAMQFDTASTEELKVEVYNARQVFKAYMAQTGWSYRGQGVWGRGSVLYWSGDFYRA